MMGLTEIHAAMAHFAVAAVPLHARPPIPCRRWSGLWRYSGNATSAVLTVRAA